MKLNIKATNLDLTDSVYTYLNEKLTGLDEFLNVKEYHVNGGSATVEAFVEVERSWHHKRGNVFRAEVQIKAPGRETLRAESYQPNLHMAIDEVKDELQRQMKRYKEKQRTKMLKGARKMKKEDLEPGT